jgi:hypothetical protein
MRLKDRVLVVTGEYAGRTGTITALDDVFGVCVHLGHIDPHCYHVFGCEELRLIDSSRE